MANEDPTRPEQEKLIKELEEDLDKKKTKRGNLAKIQSKTSAASVFLSKIKSAAGDRLSAPQQKALDDATRFLGTSSSTLRQTQVIMSIMDNAGEIFWLTLIQVMVDEMKESLNIQKIIITDIRNKIYFARDIALQIRKLNVGSADMRAIKVAHESLEASISSMEIALTVIEKGGTGYSQAKFAENLLRRASKILQNDINTFITIPGKGQVISLATQLLGAIDLIRLLKDRFAAEYLLTQVLAQGIAEFIEQIKETKSLIDREAIAANVSNILENMYKVDVEVEKTIEEKNLSAPKIIWAETKHIIDFETLAAQISSAFSQDFTSLSILEGAGSDYKILSNGLLTAPYLHPTGEILSKLTTIALKVDLSLANPFRLHQKVAEAVLEVIDRVVIGLNEIDFAINDLYAILNTYGPYRSTLLRYFGNTLRSFGYKGDVLSKFATGSLIPKPPLPSGLPINIIPGNAEDGGSLQLFKAAEIATLSSYEKKARKAWTNLSKRSEKKQEAEKRDETSIYDDMGDQVEIEDEKIVLQEETLESIKEGLNA